MHLSILNVIFVMMTLQGVTAFCLWGCDEQESSSSATSKTDVVLEGDHNVVNVLDGLRQAHDDHMTQLKIGIFAIFGLLVTLALVLACWWVTRRLRLADQSRIDRRAMSMMHRRGLPKTASGIKHGEETPA